MKRVSDNYLLRLRSELSDRDWQIISMLARVRVATAAQLEALFFPEVTRRRAQQRLSALTQRRVLARLTRVVGGVRAGSRGYVYALDSAGQRLADLDQGRRPRPPWPIGTPYLDHALTITGTYVDLVRAERSSELALARFVAEPGAWRSFYGPGGARMTLKPDAYAITRVDGFEDHWFLEIDMATESEGALSRKFGVYMGYWRSGTEQARRDVFPKVLWLVPTIGRAGVLERAVGRLPSEVRSLFVVALQDAAVARMRQGAA